MISRHNGPPITKLLDVSLARIDHGLNGEGHPFFQDLQGTGSAVVKHLGLFVKLQANAVPTKLPHHSKPVALSKFLNGVANVAQVHTGFDLHNPVPHGLIGQLAKSFGCNGGLTQQEHATGITMPSVLDHGDVDVDNVAFFKRLVIGNAVTDLVVDGGANLFGIRGVPTRCVVKGRGNGALNLGDVVVRELVELVGRDAWDHVGRQVVQDLRGEPSSHPHALNSVLIFVCNSHACIISGLKGLFTVSIGHLEGLWGFFLKSQPMPCDKMGAPEGERNFF